MCNTTPWSGSRVSGGNFTLKTLELLSLAINFNNFSGFELPQVNNFSNFGDFRQNFRKRACRAQLSFRRNETLAQIADIEKVTEAPIFLDLHAKINDFLTIFTIKPYH